MPTPHPPRPPFRPLVLLLVLAAFLAGCAGSRPAGDDAAPEEEADTTAAPAPPLGTFGPPEVPETIARRRTTAEAALDTVRAGRFDSGKMWTFDDPPLDYLEETYGFRPDDEWLERARLGALRIPGCTASFVSPQALVMTNHHCARSAIVAVSGEGEDLLTNGFYASEQATERPIPGFYAEQLIRIVDVTDQVDAALAAAETDAEVADARAQVYAAVQERLAEESGREDVVVQVISFYNGGRYAAYVYRRFEDVRLVLAPELQVAYFGGDADNFTYPRFALDMTFLRVYVDGEPYETPYYFPWSEDGADEGDLVFLIGNPGSTNRLETVAQLAYRRDVGERYLLRYIDNRVAALQAYYDEEPSDAVLNQLFSLLNAQKAYRGRVEALEDPYILARRRATERLFREALAEDPGLGTQYGGVIDTLAALQEERRADAAPYGAFFGLNPTAANSSALLRRALVAVELIEAVNAGAPEDRIAALRETLLSIPDQPRGLERRLLTARFREVRESFGEDANFTREVLMGRTPEEQAEYLLENSALAAQPELAATLGTEADGAAELNAAADPALQVAVRIAARRAPYLRETAGLDARQARLAARLGRARFDVYGSELPPDATFSLRLNDGVVRGYPYNGTVAPPITTYSGMYDHYYSYGPESEWDLPAQWVPPPPALDLATPLNFVTTNDIIGGNSGSPLLNRDLEVVGLAFDGNIESLVFAFIYLTDRARTVGVASQGMLEALEVVYDADRLVEELVATQLAPVGGTR